MEEDGTAEFRSAARIAPFGVAVVLIAMNLRGPITGVPPLLADIREALGMSLPVAALVTTLPLLAFGFLSPLVAPLAQRFGLDRTLMISLVLLGVALALRPWSGAGGFLLWTALIGVLITVANVILPVVIRRDAPTRVPGLASASTAAFGVGQGLVAFTAVPIALLIGWRWSMSITSLLVILAVAAWAVWIRMRPANPADYLKSTVPSREEFFHVFTLPDAWWVAAFFGMQSLMFYTTSTWIPDQLIDLAGIGQVAAGNALSIFHIAGIAGSLLAPVLLRLLGNAKRLGAALGLTWVVFYAGVYLTPQGWVPWMLLGGIIQGAAISLAIVLVAVRPISADFGRYFSGMVQGVGYLIAAAGPFVIEWIIQQVDSWLITTVIMCVLGVLMAATGSVAGREGKVGGGATARGR